MNSTRLLIQILVALGLLETLAALTPSDLEFFEKNVRPLLAQHCYECHSADAKELKGGLRLDHRRGVLKGGHTGPAVIPGRVGKSLLIRAIRRTEKGLEMPPLHTLEPGEIEILEKWVAIGAPDPRDSPARQSTPGQSAPVEAGNYWSFQPIADHSLPEVLKQDWPKTGIDHFVLAALESKGLSPVGDADNATLLRRISYDLIGLPPTPEQARLFLQSAAKDREQAIRSLVDEFLSKPDFGVRWARHWLDIARYSESTGGGRTLLFGEAWRYRDYVVNSFNSDKPYDRFIREQIAGDLLEGDSIAEQQDALIATAFLLLGPTNYELQDKAVLEMDIVDEQLDTMGKAFLGLTVGCARCHDHKFDPITTEDYYGLAGIMKGTKVVIHSNVSTWNKRPLPVAAETLKKSEERKKQLNALQREIATLKKKTRGRRPTAIPVVDLAGIVVDDLEATLKGDWTRSTSNAGFVAEHYLHDGASEKGEKQVSYRVRIPGDGKFEVRVSYTEGTNRDRKVPVLIRHADGEIVRYVDQTRAPPIDGSFISLGTYDFLAGDWEAVVISNRGTTAHVIADAIQLIPEGGDPASSGKISPAADPVAPGAAERKKRIEELEQELKQLKTETPLSPMVIAAEEGASPGDINIAVRGNVHNAGRKTPRGFIKVLQNRPTPSFAAGHSGRRELADWISSRENPLTARVFVNRVWHHLFGRGLVSSVDNFGHMGQPPSNPELLDHLAIRFIEENWSIKMLIREIMLSRVYQLSSDPEPSRAQVDLENILHWRQNRRRLQAEPMRDSILQISGSLDSTLGGSTIKPGTKTEYGYIFQGNRRTIYTPVFRNTLPEMMQVFDFADPNLVTGQRTTSSVATQALFLMNNPFVSERARQAAVRLLREQQGTRPQKVEWAYQATLGRKPTVKETEIIIAFLGNEEDPESGWSQVFQSLFASLDFRYLN